MRSAILLAAMNLFGMAADALEAPPDPIEQRIEAAREAAAKKDILAWGKAIMPEKFFLPFCHELHDYFISIRHEKMTSTVAPRNHAKTLVKCCLIPMFQALEEPETYDYYLNIQATSTKGVAVNFAIKHEFQTNEVLRAIYGDQTSETKWTDAQFMLKNGVIFQGAGAGESIRGLQFLNRRPKYTVIDDLYDEGDIEHPESVEAKNRWLWGSLYPTRSKGKGTSFQMQGTAIGDNDAMKKMSEMPGVVSREFAAYDEKTNKVLWAELNTLEDLKEERIRMGSVAFDREMQGKRRNTAESIIKEHWLNGWEYDPAIRWANIARDFGPKSEVRIMGAKLGCDPSTGKDEGDPAAFCLAIETMGPGSRKDWWIEYLEEAILSFDARLAKLETIKSQHNGRYPDPVFRMKRAFIESIGGFMDFGNQAKKKTGLPIEIVTWVKGKKANLAAKSGHFEFGRVHISTAIPKQHRDALVDQLLINEPTHDDVRDSVLLILEEPDTVSMKAWV